MQVYLWEYPGMSSRTGGRTEPGPGSNGALHSPSLNGRMDTFLGRATGSLGIWGLRLKPLQEWQRRRRRRSKSLGALWLLATHGLLKNNSGVKYFQCLRNYEQTFWNVMSMVISDVISVTVRINIFCYLLGCFKIQDSISRLYLNFILPRCALYQ